MTTTPHGQVPEALRLADWLQAAVQIFPQRSEDDPGGYASEVDQIMDEAAAELRRLHAYCQELESQVILDCMTHVQKPAEIEHVAGDVLKNGAEVNMNVYAELPQSVGDHKYGGGLYTDAQMLAFADATHALRTQQPAPATQQAGEMEVFGLQWPGEDRINLSTVFDTEAEALEYRQNRCDTPGIRLVRFSSNAPTAQAAESVPAGPSRKDMLWSTVKMQERHDQRIENIVSGLERIKQEHAGQQPQKIDECYGDCPTDSTTCTNPCRFDGRAARDPADSVLEDAARLTTEQEYAIRQGHESAASEGYFEARPQIDCNDGRRVFKAGYERGWDAARKQGGA